MKFCILFALACVCPVAFSHQRYIAIPVSALINGRPDSEANAIVYDINPLQVRDSAAGRSRSSLTSTAVRRTSTTGGRSGERSAVTSTAVRNRGSIRRIAPVGTQRRFVNMITRTPVVTNRRAISAGSIRRVAAGRRRGPAITRTVGSIRRVAGGSRRGPAITRSVGSIRRVAAGTRRGPVNMITRRPAITRSVGSITPRVTYLPSGTGTYVAGNARYISSVSPGYTSGYVNSVYQPHIVAGSSYQPGVTSTGYYGRWPNVQGASYVVNAAIQQPFTNSQYLGWPQYQSYMSNQPLFRSIL